MKNEKNKSKIKNNKNKQFHYYDLTSASFIKGKTIFSQLPHKE